VKKASLAAEGQDAILDSRLGFDERPKP